MEEDRDDRIRKGFLLSDRCPIVRMGMKEFLRAFPGTEVLGEAECAEGTARMAGELKPDYVVLDPRFDPSGEFCVEICRRLKALSGSLQVIVYTYHDEPSGVAAALLAGADHYVYKGLGRVETERVREGIVAGQRVIRPGPRTPSYGSSHLVTTCKDRLTRRQQQVFELLTRRRTNAEIAAELYVSKQTVRNYVSAVFRTCEVENRVEFYGRLGV